ncbi:MAG: hypothetical protein WCH99_14720 [Verrucomicrobiota bacterium]
MARKPDEKFRCKNGINLGICFMLLALGLLVAGCVSPVPGASRNLLSFMQNGQTTRQEVILKLGQPSGSFEHEQILTYRIGEDKDQGYYLVSPKFMQPWQSVRYSLVLLFDDRGVLQKKNMVSVQ